MRQGRKTSLVFWLALLPAAAALRVWAAARAFAPNFDSATPGLMALDLLAGERLPLMYYGQAYFGALEVYVSAAWMALLGPTDLALALGPVTCSLAWIATLHALVRRLAGPRAALGAAALAAFPGWGMLWLNLTSLGGYPTTWFLGTLAWLLAVRIDQDDRPPAQSAPAVAALGLAAGLAVWVNFQSAPLLVMALAFFTPWLARHRRASKLLPVLIAAAALFLLAVSPILLVSRDYTGLHTASWNPSPAQMLEHASITLTKALPPVLLGPARESSAAVVLLLLLLAAAAVLRLRCPAARTLAGRSPWVVAAVFLFFFLPHPMAAEGGSRYLLTTLVWLLIGLLAWPLEDARPTMRRAAAALLALWIALNLLHVFQAVKQSSERRAERVTERERAVAAARSTGAAAVELAGGYIFGHEGQVFSWAAKDKLNMFSLLAEDGPPFVSVYDERRVWLAQEIETMDGVAIGCPPALYFRMLRTFHSLGFKAQRAQTKPVSFFWDVSGHRNAARGFVPVAGKLLRAGSPGPVARQTLDRVFDTFAEGAAGEGLWLDLGRTLPLDRLWLCEPNPYQDFLPESIVVETSVDGQAWRVALDCKERFASAYAIEGRVYVDGFMGQMELQLDGAEARFVRIIARATQAKSEGRWRIGEVLAFERTGGPVVGTKDLAGVAAAAVKSGVKTLFANRWLSARLYGDARFAVLPRFNSKYAPSQRTRIPAAGDAILVLAELADETATVLTDAGANFDRSEVDGRTMLVLRDLPDGVRLYWTGHRLLRLTGPEPRGY